MKRLSPSTKYLLQAFIPYTDANIQLAFKPAAFFDELGKKSKVKERSLRSAYYRAIKSGLLEIDDYGIPRLTNAGRLQIKLYRPKKLPTGAKLMIIFDIPETERYKRNHLRSLLKELSFKKVQQSVWVSQYDHREIVAAEIKEYKLQEYVYLFEALQINK